MVKGGSRRYVEKIIEPLEDRIRLSSPIGSIRRRADAVFVRPVGADEERFDHVVIAAHSDQALAMLADPTDDEMRTLGVIRYQQNDVVVHTDRAVLPARTGAWAAWNYHIPREKRTRVAVTYNMNILQTLDAPDPFCVTLNNRDDVQESHVARRVTYHHPVYTTDGVAAQSRQLELSRDRTHYCGAYWGHGFHEDGVQSALRVCARFGESL